MLRILHIVQSLNVGGLENGVVNLVNQANNSRIKVDVLCLRDKGVLADKITNPNSQVYFDEKSAEGIGASIKATMQLCRQNRYDIVHTHGWATMLPGYIATKLTRTPKVINGEHGTLYYASKKQKVAQRILFSLVDLNLSVSRLLIDEIRNRFSYTGDNFKPILNGVDREKFSPNVGFRKDNRAALGISDDEYVIGSVGRLVEVKNYPCLIRAFAKLTNNIKCKLVLAGYGDQRESLEALVNTMGVKENVLFLGRRSDIPQIINAFDVFVLPSFREGLSNTILESLSCGVPVIASDVGGNSELVKHGENGYLFESDNDAQLAERIQGLLQEADLLTKFSQTARELVLESFSLEQMVQNYEDTYYDLMREN